MASGLMLKFESLIGINDTDPAQQRERLVWLAVGVVALFLPLLLQNDANVDAVGTALSFAMLALGLNIILGFGGMYVLGYAAFFAVGAYTYGILSSYQIMPPWSAFWEPFEWLGLVSRHPGWGSGALVHFTLSFWLALPICALLAAGFGILFALPTLRLRGDYLSIVTLGVGEIVPIVIRNASGLTGGANGLNGIATPRLFGYDFGVSATPYYYLALLMTVLIMFVSVRLRDSRIGRSWMALREDQIAADAAGIDPIRTKLLAFAIGAGIAGMTGCLYVAKLQTATPEMFGFPVSVMLLVMIVFGGIASVRGVVVGAIILQLLQSWWLQDLTEWTHVLGRMIGSQFLERVNFVSSSGLIFGVILVLTMLYLRQGLLPDATKQRALTYEQQNAVVQRGTEIRLAGVGGPVGRGGKTLEIRGLTVRFDGLVALNAVDLTVPAGQVVAVIGPNGSGKSTLFNAITGLTPVSGGAVLHDGQDITGFPPHRILKRGIVRTFQNIRLFSNLTVMENVLIGQHARLRTNALQAVLRGRKARQEESDARRWALEIISIFGNRLMPRLDQAVYALSYANRRRTEISRALASRPQILLLDEPTAGMNPAETLELAEQIRGLHALGLTILLIEHKLDVVTQLADTVYVLDHGDIIASGTPAEVRNNEEVIRAYMGFNAQAAWAGIPPEDGHAA